MPIKAVQQFMLGTVLSNENEARQTLAVMKAAGYDGIELCGFMIHPIGFMVRLLTKAAGMPVGKGGDLDWHKLVKDAAARGLIYFERDILAHNVNILNIRALEYTGYVAHVCDMKSYFDENLKLIDEKNLNALFPKQSPVYTKIRDDNPTRYVTGSNVSNSLLADGCVIEGTVENCVLFRGVKVKKGAVVKNCVLMQDTVVEAGVELDCVVTDKNVRITADKKLSGTKSFPVYVQKNHIV